MTRQRVLETLKHYDTPLLLLAWGVASFLIGQWLGSIFVVDVDSARLIMSILGYGYLALLTVTTFVQMQLVLYTTQLFRPAGRDFTIIARLFKVIVFLVLLGLITQLISIAVVAVFTPIFIFIELLFSGGLFVIVTVLVTIEYIGIFHHLMTISHQDADIGREEELAKKKRP